MIAGTSSGCGKSTVAMGLNRLLYRKGFRVQPWKCGPDYIDPGFHSLAAHRICRNLDTRLMDTSALNALFQYHTKDADICPVEGVMGYYDGEAGRFDKGSSYDLSRELNLPVFIVLDVSSAAQSAGAMALGFQAYRKDAPIAGFILNRAGSRRHESMVRDAVEEATGKPVVGVIPKNQNITLPSRHLGLKMASEEGYALELDRTLEALADLMEESLDLDLLLSLSSLNRMKELDQVQNLYLSTPPVFEGVQPVIAVARDDAFSFYYQDNLDLLENRGARLAFFSPIHDSALPPGCGAVYFGGGYPERFVRELSDNTTLMEELRRRAGEGMPIYGECGGYMYLAESLRTLDGTAWPMSHILPGEVIMSKGLKALGYGSVTWKRDSFLAPAGTTVPGHLFHWSCLEHPIDSNVKPLFEMDKKDEILLEGYQYKNVLASYIHFHFASYPKLAENFVKAAAVFLQRQEQEVKP
jgi:cobyrinic acid a,c-diamide synthase